MALAIEAFITSGNTPKTIHQSVWYVRLKPHDIRAGHKLRDITLSKWRTRIRESKGWHRIATSNREMLNDFFTMTQTGYASDPYAPKAFDVCTFEEAKLTEKREKEEKMRKREVRADVEHANVLRSADLPSRNEDRAEATAEARKATAAARQAAIDKRETRREQAKAEAAAMNAEERAAEIERLKRVKAASEAELDAMDAEDDNLADEGNALSAS